MVRTINSIGLHPLLVETMVEFLEYTELTQVQQHCFTSIISGRNIFVRSPTSFGNTLAYASALVHQLQGIRPKLTCVDGARAVVIVPTHQLAIQTLEVFVKLLKPFKWLVPTHISSDNDHESEKVRPLKGFNIIIATPRRFCDLLQRGLFELGKVNHFVLDGADRLFELGYGKHVKIIVEALLKFTEPERPLVVNFAQKASEVLRNKPLLQSLLVSATLSLVVEQFSSLLLEEPLFIDMCDEEKSEFPKTILIAKANTSFVTERRRTTSVSNGNELFLTQKLPSKVAVTDCSSSSKENDMCSSISNVESIERMELLNPFPIVATTREVAEVNISHDNIPEAVTQSYVLVPSELRQTKLTELIGAENNKKILVYFAKIELLDSCYDIMTERITKKGLDSDIGDDGKRPLLDGVKFFK